MGKAIHTPHGGLGAQRREVFPRLVHLLAAISLVFIIWLFLLIWPIPLLGFTTDPISDIVLAVEMGSPAAQVGLAPGDRLVALYGVPWPAVKRQINVLSLHGPREPVIPIVVERGGRELPLVMSTAPPTAGFQAVKIIHLSLALLCWVTGYLLGVVRHEHAGAHGAAAIFWLTMSALMMGYLVAALISLPLRIFLQWLTLTTLAPLAVAVHALFPVRPEPGSHEVRSSRGPLVTALLANLGLAVVVAWWRPSLNGLALALGQLLPPVLLVVLLGSGALLLRDYRRTLSAHVRRQIRLIGTACLLVALTWFWLLVVPIALGDLVGVSDQGLNGVMALIPLAYLISGVSPDLYRIDRLTRRLAGHFLALSVLLIIIVGAVGFVGPRNDLMLLLATMYGVLLYRPSYRVALRLLGERATGSDYAPLGQAIRQLTTTLESAELIEACLDGVAATFRRPAFALYLGDLDGGNRLQLTRSAHVALLPPVVPGGALAATLLQLGRVSDGKRVEQALGGVALSEAEQHLLYQPDVALWCPIYHADGHLLGLLMLGRRGDLDMYRPQDVQELQRLIDAAALAFAHSAAYQRRVEAERLSQELYYELDRAQVETGMQIAGSIHEDVINARLRLNIDALSQLLPRVDDPWLREELEAVKEIEEALVVELRMVCEDLHPPTVYDPLGLEAMLRVKVERAAIGWQGEYSLSTVHDAVPLPLRLQREMVRIAGEAVINAVKHAEAANIWVELTYPAGEGCAVELLVRDDGVGFEGLPQVSGHRGLRDMSERARRAGGCLKLQSAPGTGTAVRFTCLLDGSCAKAVGDVELQLAMSPMRSVGEEGLGWASSGSRRRTRYGRWSGRYAPRRRRGGEPT